jgi:hypothetical protein
MNYNDPIHRINEGEFDSSLLQFGAFVSILKNKRINQTLLLSELLEKEQYRECFTSISEIDDNYVLIKKLVEKYPILCKSKIIKNKIKELNSDRRRKKIL